MRPSRRALLLLLALLAAGAGAWSLLRGPDATDVTSDDAAARGTPEERPNPTLEGLAATQPRPTLPAPLPLPPDLALRRAPASLVGMIDALPVATGTFVGHVHNADGVPVEGARVMVYRQPTKAELSARSPNSYGSSGWVVLPGEVFTTASGEFRKDDVPAGISLFVTVMPPHDLPWSGRIDELGDPLRVDLPRAYSLSGRVLDAVTGEPVAKARVVALRQIEAGTQAYGGGGEARTGADGAFALGGLSAGTYTLRAHPNLSRSDSLGLDAELVPEGVEVTASLAVEAGATNAELRVWRGYVIEGRVAEASGDAPEHALRIEIFARTEKGEPDQRRRAFASVEPDGTFRVDALPAGSYDLLFQPVPHPAATAPVAAGLTWVRDVRAPASDVQVVLVHGRVLRGRLVDAAGKPVLGRQGFVYVWEDGTPSGGVGSVYATLYGEGGFVTPALPEDKAYSILVGGFPDTARTQLHGVRIGEDELTIRLTPGSRIRGLVRDPERRVVGPGVRVVAWVEDGGIASLGGMASAYTDVTGQFVLEGLTAPTYALAAGGANGRYAPAPAISGVLPGAAAIELSVEAGRTLSGRLVDARGRPMPALLLQAWRVGGSPADMATTRVDNAEGLFLLTGLRAGRVLLTFLRDGKPVPLGEAEVPGDGVRLVVPDP